MRLPGDRTTGDHPENASIHTIAKKKQAATGISRTLVGIDGATDATRSKFGGGILRANRNRKEIGRDPAGSTDAVLFNSGGPIPGRCLNCGDPAHHRYGNPVEDEGQDDERGEYGTTETAASLGSPSRRGQPGFAVGPAIRLAR
jgi:hypothetical protein